MFEGLTAAQIAEQDGHPVKIVRTNIKNALRSLHAMGLASHAATDEDVRQATAPARPEQNSKHKSRKSKAAAQTFIARLRKQLTDLAPLTSNR